MDTARGQLRLLPGDLPSWEAMRNHGYPLQGSALSLFDCQGEVDILLGAITITITKKHTLEL